MSDQRASITQNELPLQRLRQVFYVDAERGVLVWRERPDAKKVRAGTIAGYTNPKRGYWQVRLDGKLYAAHRVIWSLLHGHIPPRMQIDHIDGNPANNRPNNLRLATNQENARNTRARRSTHGVKGVCFHPHSGLWNARLVIDGRVKSLGYYGSPEEAGSVYAKAARAVFGEFARAS